MGGQIFGFLGPNGAGKSTLVKMVVGLLFPTSGTARLLGRQLGDLGARRKIGFLPENFRYQDWLTGEELLIVHYNTGLSVSVQAGAIGLFCLQPVILLAVTMFGTTFLSTLANGIGSFMLYAVGVVGGMLEQIGYLAKSQVLVNIGIVSSLVMPADSVYRKIVYTLMSAPGVSFSSFMMGPFGSVSEPSGWMLAYTGLYILFFLAMALKIFARRDI